MFAGRGSVGWRKWLGEEGANADPVPNSPLWFGNLSAEQVQAAPSPPLNLSCSPVWAQSKSTLSSNLFICKTGAGGGREGSRKAVAFLRRKQPWLRNASKSSLTALCLPCTWISQPWPLSRGLALCRVPALPPSWHPSSSSSPSALVLTSKPVLGHGGASQAASTPQEPRQAPAPSRFHADQNLPPPLLLWSWRGFGWGAVRSRGARGARAQGWGLSEAAGHSILHLRGKLGKRLYT